MPQHVHRREFIQTSAAAAGVITAAAGTAALISTPKVSAQETLVEDRSNPPWFPSLMAFEHYDSGRTKLFEQAHFTGSFTRANAVDVRVSPDDYPTVYNGGVSRSRLAICFRRRLWKQGRYRDVCRARRSADPSTGVV